MIGFNHWLACRIKPSATVAAVVERSVNGPMPIELNPLSLAETISSLVQPPSGPIAKQVFCGFIMEGWDTLVSPMSFC